MLKLIVNWVNSISRWLLGIGIIDLFQKASASKSRFQQAREIAKKHRYIEALKIGEQIIDEWYNIRLNVEDQFRRLMMKNFLKEAKAHLAIWEPLALREYDAALERSHWLATEGRWQEAIALLEPIQHQFFQPQGKKLLDKIYQIFAGKTSLKLGLFAEQAGNLEVAREHYQNAISVSPEWNLECQIRLGIIAVKSEKWAEAISHLESINTEQATYIRGFALAKQGKLPQAEQEWQNISHLVDLKDLKKLYPTSDLVRDKDNAKREIQELVDQGNLWQAMLDSQDFIQKFGDEPIVKENLYKNILPRIEITLWREQKWQIVNQIIEQRWLREWDIAALHNLALANYYQAGTNTTKLENLIVTWSAAIANLHLNPSLHNLPWLGETAIDWQEVTLQLQQQIEPLLKRIEEPNLAEYTRLFDLYRLEVKALNLMGTPSSAGLRVKGLFITPGFYQCYCHKLKVNLSAGSPLWALYTSWWRSVLACMEGDTFTAMQIKPKSEPTSEAEMYARKFVAYHEGCYYLDIPLGGYPRWRSAVVPLSLAKSEINQNYEWLEHIEQLCQKQYNIISWNKEDSKEFTQFWYNLIASATAQDYLEQVNY
ncbi:MAG: hypothetical protein V7K32_06520 [Nostoc sp.]|uniref:tetratricopeptide repeat protein n=1 Tax=Nostoc sp. TaxID=1180 RepID=UPI002FF79812